MAVRPTLCVLMMVAVVVMISLVPEVESRRRGERSKGHHRQRRKWFPSLHSRWERGRGQGRDGDGGLHSLFGRHRAADEGWGYNPFRHHRFSDFFQHARSPWDFDFSFDLDFGFPSRRRQNWWEGPHVCRRETGDNGTDSEADSILHNFKTTTQVCEMSDLAYKCTTSAYSPVGVVKKVVLYECCHGYGRNAGEYGCPHKRDLVDLLSLVNRLELEDVLAAIQTAELEEVLTSGNFTLFAPVNVSFPLPVGPGVPLQGPDRNRVIEVSPGARDKMEGELQAQLLGHILPEPRYISSFSDEDVVETASPEESTIRINFYSWPKKLITANCVPVLSTDHVATNGVLHTVRKVLPVVSLSLLDFIQRDEQFSFLKTALARANLVSTLQDDGQLTLFAPTDSAFQRLDPQLRDRVLAGDLKCLDKIVKNHLLSNVICSAVIEGRTKSKNVLDKTLNLTRTDDNKLFVESAQVVRADVMATNGVMHIIDAVLVPDDALDVMSVAEKNGLTDLVQLVEKADFIPFLLNSSDITIFVPSNTAFEAVPPEVMKELTSDQDMLQNLLAYHVVSEPIHSRHLRHGRLLDTYNAQGKIRVDKYSASPFGHQHVTTVQCARLVTRNIPSCNGIIHVIDKVLLPPKGNVVDVLAADPQFSSLVRLIKRAGLADSLQAQGPFTVFAPTNKAFDNLGKEKMKELDGDLEQLESILKRHISLDHMCCAGIMNGDGWFLKKTHMISTAGSYLSLEEDRSGRFLVGDAVIESCDNIATNGVVQAIDTVLLPKPSPWSFLFRW